MVTCKMPLFLIRRTLLYSGGIRPPAENSPSTAWRKFHARSTQHTEGAISCRTGGQFEVENIAIGGSRKIKDRPQVRMPSRNVQLPQSIDDARRALVGTLHHFLDLCAGARRIEPKPDPFALRQKLRVRNGGRERVAQRGQALDRNAWRQEERPAECERRKRRLHQQLVVVACDEIGGEWHIGELGELFRPILHDGLRGLVAQPCGPS